MPLPRLPKSNAIAAAAAAVAVAAVAAWWFWPVPGAPQLPPGQSLEVSQLETLAPLPAFELETATGPLVPAALRGNWTWVFFGYTNCPDACPTTLLMLQHAGDALRTRGLPQPRVLFVTLDPQRDTAEVLQRYASSFGSGVTGARGATPALLEFFGVSFERHAAPDGAVTLDHTASIFLITPDGRWLATFQPVEDADALVEDMARLEQLSLPH